MTNMLTIRRCSWPNMYICFVWACMHLCIFLIQTHACTVTYMFMWACYFTNIKQCVHIESFHYTFQALGISSPSSFFSQPIAYFYFHFHFLRFPDRLLIRCILTSVHYLTRPVPFTCTSMPHFLAFFLLSLFPARISLLIPSSPFYCRLPFFLISDLFSVFLDHFFYFFNICFCCGMFSSIL